MRSHQLASRRILWVTRALGAFGLAVLGTLPAAATTRFVNRGSAQCSDAGSGTSSAPYCTIGKGATVAVAGDTVLVSSGTYPEDVHVANSGTATSPIVIRAADGASVTVSGQLRGFEISTKSWITLSGFTVTGTTSYGIYVNNSTNITVSGNRVTLAGQPVSGSTAVGFYINSTTDSTFAGNTADHNSDAGFLVTNGSTRLTLVGNTSAFNARGYTRAAPGIDVRSAGNTIKGNICHDNEDSGIQVYPYSVGNPSPNNLIVGNLCYNNGDHGIDINSAGSQRIIGNTVFNSVTSGINVEGPSSGTLIANNVSVDNAINSTTTRGNIRVDATSQSGTTLDYDLVFQSHSGQVQMAWGSISYDTLADFKAVASGQETHGLEADPRFTASASGNFHLNAGSPAIDSANSTVSGQLNADIENKPRVDDTTTPDTGLGPPRTYDDRGAYEFQPSGGATCGNGVKDAGEQCDGSALGGATCSSQGCTGGTPSCTSNCVLNYATCTGCPVCTGGNCTFVDVRVAASSDDAEENASGDVSLSSSDLELTFDSSNQTVGMRFNGIAVAKGATITNAWIQFTAKETQSEATSLQIQGQGIDNAPTFTSGSSSISTRTRTAASVPWAPLAWNTVGQAGTDQRTPSLKTVIQEIVNRSGWVSGNSLAIIITGTGHRTPYSYDGSSSLAPLLHLEVQSGAQTNTAPNVYAGPDKAITLPSGTSMAGTVSDDGLPNPPAAVTCAWTTTSGPGQANFANSASPTSSVTFPASGLYVLRLTCSDSQLQAFDEVSITVNPASASGGIDVRVAASSDDAEENAAGDVSLSSSDLELTFDSSNQTVGMRFNGIAVAKGATITNAWIQFTAKETQSEATSLQIQGQAIDNAPTFTSSSSSISTRARTAASVPWAPLAWSTVGQAGADQRTPSLKTVIQEIVNRAGWVSGNSLVIVITGTGHRTPYSYDGSSSLAPLLHIEVQSGAQTNTAPNVYAGPDNAITLPSGTSMAGTVGDDGLPNPPATTTCGWTTTSGPGQANFTDSTSPTSAVTFPASGLYVLRLTCSDSQLQAFDEVSITVNPAGTGGVLDVRVADSSDDAEEDSSGGVSLSSSDLELTFDSIYTGNQTIGIRFNGITVPRGTLIKNAWIQFTAKETQSEATSLLIQGQAIDNAPTFASSDLSISPRARTAASASWAPVAWTLIGQAGTGQRTPSLTAVVQEIVNRSGWVSGNSLVIIITGTGHRTAWSYNGNSSSAALLHIEY